MSIFNYIRVSTQIQNTERQLQGVPSDVEFLEKVSGKDKEREQLNLMLKIVKSGDVVNVHSMDRLARNTQNLLEIVEEITGKGAEIKFHKEGMVFNNDENNPFSQLMLTMIGAFSEFERNIMLERQREGIAIAKSKGKYKGRKTVLSDEQLAEMKIDFNSGTMKKTEIAKKYNLTRARIYQLCA